MVQRQSHYELLGIDSDATLQEIRAAFLALAHQFHPDLNSTQLESDETFKRLRTAYETLANSTTRREYDKKIEAVAKKQGARREYVVPHRSLQTVWLNDPTTRRERIFFCLSFVIMVAVIAIGIIVQEKNWTYRNRQKFELDRHRYEASARRIEKLAELNLKRSQQNAEKSSDATSGSNIALSNERTEPNNDRKAKYDVAAIALPTHEKALTFSDFMVDVTSESSAFVSIPVTDVSVSFPPMIDDFSARIEDFAIDVHDGYSSGSGPSFQVLPQTQDLLTPSDPLFNAQQPWDAKPDLADGSIPPASTESNYGSRFETNSSYYDATPVKSYSSTNGVAPTNGFLPTVDFYPANIPMPRSTSKSTFHSFPSSSGASPFSPNVSYDMGFGRRSARTQLRSPGLRAKGMSNPFGSPRLRTNSFPLPKANSNRRSFLPAPVSSGLPPEYQY